MRASVVLALAFVQTILHYLGWLGVVLGIVAFGFGNHARGTELLIGGAGMIVAKYVLSALVFGLAALFGHRPLESPRG